MFNGLYLACYLDLRTPPPSFCGNPPSTWNMIGDEYDNETIWLYLLST
jgi:hypothetical protein